MFMCARDEQNTSVFATLAELSADYFKVTLFNTSELLYTFNIGHFNIIMIYRYVERPFIRNNNGMLIYELVESYRSVSIRKC